MIFKATMWSNLMSSVCFRTNAMCMIQALRAVRILQIFLEMVVIGKHTLLHQLSKTDKNIMGKQLQTLLCQDFSSEKGASYMYQSH